MHRQSEGAVSNSPFTKTLTSVLHCMNAEAFIHLTSGRHRQVNSRAIPLPQRRGGRPRAPRGRRSPTQKPRPSRRSRTRTQRGRSATSCTRSAQGWGRQCPAAQICLQQHKPNISNMLKMSNLAATPCIKLSGARCMKNVCKRSTALQYFFPNFLLYIQI